MAQEVPQTFDAVNERLEQIVQAVSSDDLSLDDALVLYEEAVSLGMRASDLLESDVDVDSAVEDLKAEAAGEREEPTGIQQNSSGPVESE